MTVTTKPYARERLIAELAVQRVAVLTRKVLSSALNRRRNSQIAKSDTSPVTVADFAVQALLISAVHAVFPHDGFVGEEDAEPLRSDPALAQAVWDLIDTAHLETNHSNNGVDGGEEIDYDALLARPRSIEHMCDLIDLGGRGQGGRTDRRFWALDPIDGTAAFVKNQQYAVSLALVEDGREVLGVLACPNLRLACVPDETHSNGRPANERARVRETCVDEDGLGLMLSAVRGQGALMRPIGRGALLEARRIDRRIATCPSSPTLTPTTTTTTTTTTPPPPAAAEHVPLSQVHFIDSSVSPATRSDKVHQLAEAMGAPYPGTEIYSSHMRYAALILGGREHVQVRYPSSRQARWCIWDHAGSQLIYTESGAGKVTDLQGRPIDFGKGRKIPNWGVITADVSCHGRILELVTEMVEADTDG